MSEEMKQPEQQAEQQQQQAPTEEPKEYVKEYTKADVERLVTERLEAEREKAEAEAKKAKMEMSERLKLEKQEAEDRAKAAEDRARTLEYRAELKGEVVDVNAALKLIDESHVVDGQLSVAALIKQYPFLKLNTPVPHAGGLQNDGRDVTSLSAALAQQQYRGNR